MSAVFILNKEPSTNQQFFRFFKGPLLVMGDSIDTNVSVF